MKPLLAAAKKVGLDLPELRRLVAEAAAGHDADLAQRVRLVEQVKGTLEAALVERIAESLQSVLIDIERMKAATQQVHAAEMTAAILSLSYGRLGLILYSFLSVYYVLRPPSTKASARESVTRGR